MNGRSEQEKAVVIDPQDPMLSGAPSLAVDDAREGSQIEARPQQEQSSAPSRQGAEVDVGEPDRAIVILVFLGLVGLLTFVEFSRFGGSPTASELARSGGAGIGTLATGSWWKLIVSNFLHSGPIHLALNVFVIYLTGRWLEHLAGRLIVIATITWSIVLASVGSLLIDAPTVAIGASGVAFGLVGCAIAIDPRARTTLGEVARQLAIVNVVLTFVVPGISIGGHLGGLAAGLIVGTITWQRAGAEESQIGSPRAFAATLTMVLSAFPLLVMAVGPQLFPSNAYAFRSNAMAHLLGRQLSGSKLSNGLEINSASCQATDHVLHYQCKVNDLPALVTFSRRDDQWSMRMASK